MTDLAELLHEIDGSGKHHWRPVTTKQRVADKIHGHWSRYCCCGLYKSRWKHQTAPKVGNADEATRCISAPGQLTLTKGDDDAD